METITWVAAVDGTIGPESNSEKSIKLVLGRSGRSEQGQEGMNILYNGIDYDMF